MSTEVEAYVGDIGTQIILDTGENLATATDQAIKVKKPSGVEDVWDGTVVETTKVSHNTGTGDFDESGIYKLQAYVEMPAWSGHGGMVAIRVSPLYEG